jgi:parallel beta-helix repeat protein
MYDTAYKTGDQTDCGNPYKTVPIMQAGIGYFLRANRSCEFSFDPPSTIDVTLVYGMNIISVPTRTTVDDIARICGIKDAIFGYMKSSSSSCWYDDHGYLIGYNGSINNTGDCGTSYITTDTMEPYIGYFVRFLGRNGDPTKPCYLRYVNGVLSEAPLSTTTSIGQTTTSRSTTTTSQSTTTSVSSIQPVSFTVGIEGASYVARNSTGHAMLSNAKFVMLMNSLSPLVKSGQTVLIKDGLYPVDSHIDWQASGSTIIGQSPSAILQSSRSFFSSSMMRIGGGQSSRITVTNLTFDNNLTDNGYPPLIVVGSYNTVRGCRFLNIQQYGLLAYGADHFIFAGNYIEKAQYGIATGGGWDGSVMNPWDSDGIIANNTIRDARDVGIKLRWCRNVTVYGNDIDVGYRTWGKAGYDNGHWGTSVGSDSPINGSTGICFYQADGPDINVTVRDNTIYDSVKSGSVLPAGITISPDVPSNNPGYPGPFSSGQVIANNTIRDVYFGILGRSDAGTGIGRYLDGKVSGNTIASARWYGILLGWTAYDGSNAKVYGNTITGSGRYGIFITSGTDNCTLSGNIVSGSGIKDIQDNGAGNIVKSADINVYVLSPSGSSFSLKSPSGDMLFTGNATAALQKAFDSAAVGDVVLLKAGTYTIGKTVYGKSGVSLRGEKGALISLGGLGNMGFGIRYRGDSVASGTLTAQGAKGSSSISVSSSSAFSQGSLIFIYNPSVEWKGNTRHQKQGEIRTVKSVSGNVITLESPLEDTYMAGSSIAPVNAVKDFEVSGLTFSGVKDLNQSCLSVWFAKNVRVHDNNFSYCQLYAVDFGNVLNSEVYGNRFVHSDMAGYGYGLTISYASSNVSVYDNYGDTCRHMIAIGGGSGNGIPRHLYLTRLYSTRSTNAAFDCHPVGEDINYVNNTSENDEYGINVEMFSGTVIGNIVKNPAEEGIKISNLVGSDNVTIYNNTVIGSGGHGIVSQSKHVNIVYNNLTNCGPSSSYYAILLMKGSSTDNDAIAYQYSADYNNIYGNIISSTTGSKQILVQSGVIGTTYNKP